MIPRLPEISEIKPLSKKYGWGFTTEQSLAMTGLWPERTNGFLNWVVKEGIFSQNNLKYENSNIKYAIDAFSPNLNKDYLHIGHFRCFLVANFLRKVGQELFTLYGANQGVNNDLLTQINKLYREYDYKPNQEYTDDYLFQMSLLGRYKTGPNSLVRSPEDPNLLCIPDSNKHTTGDDNKLQPALKLDENGIVERYFYPYPDFILAREAPYLRYICDESQSSHFRKLGIDDRFYPMGLVTDKEGKKLSSREGNALSIDAAYELVYEGIGKEDKDLARNILIGTLLYPKLLSPVKVDKSLLCSVKTSPGMYISYTNARIEKLGLINNGSSGLPASQVDVWGPMLYTTYYKNKSIEACSPHYLIRHLHDMCIHANSIYEESKMNTWSDEKKSAVEKLSNDIKSTMSVLGMVSVGEI